MAKRSGLGGNLSRDPRGNLVAQKSYSDKTGNSVKRCTGFLHHDQSPIPITSFRQQKSNSSTGLQSRCDTCNRLYFSIIQKPVKRLAAIVIWSNETGDFDWQSSSPESLKLGLQKTIDYWSNNPCKLENCEYPNPHSNFRAAATFLTKNWRNLDKDEKTSSVLDPKTGLTHAAPKFMSDLQEWASTGGRLYSEVSVEKVWQWWTQLFSNDSATCSKERNAFSSGEITSLPAHPLEHFPWGNGNILDTNEGHSVPGFNQVRSSESFLSSASSVNGRPYGFLVEGDHIAMARYSAECKDQGLSLGHYPAPLRWLGKNDPINGLAQPLQENIALSDSLAPLHAAAVSDPAGASTYVSWQISALVKQLGEEKVVLEVFSQRIEAAVEEYFDVLETSLNYSTSTILRDLNRADPGRTQVQYDYRLSKVVAWLKSRPKTKKRIISEKA